MPPQGQIRATRAQRQYRGRDVSPRLPRRARPDRGASARRARPSVPRAPRAAAAPARGSGRRRSMSDARLDAALVERGLARSRTHAARLIADGLVTIGGRLAVKPAIRVTGDDSIEVAPTDSYVSRAAHKLVAALDGFAVPVAGRLALDAGA